MSIKAASSPHQAGIESRFLRCGNGAGGDCQRTSFAIPKRDVERSRHNNKFAISWHQLQVCNGLLEGHKINAGWVNSHHHSVHTH